MLQTSFEMDGRPITTIDAKKKIAEWKMWKCKERDVVRKICSTTDTSTTVYLRDRTNPIQMQTIIENLPDTIDIFKMCRLIKRNLRIIAAPINSQYLNGTVNAIALKGDQVDKIVMFLTGLGIPSVIGQKVVAGF
jgi:translation initiation factor 1 (eIF-1/SUI1)